MIVPLSESPSIRGAHGKGSPHPSDQFDVVVFGAGIAGLTVAHELMARNYSVLVVDRAGRAASDVGGVAKSQSAYVFRDDWVDEHSRKTTFIRATSGHPPDLPCVKYQGSSKTPLKGEYDKAVHQLERFWDTASKVRNRPPSIDVSAYSTDPDLASGRAADLIKNLQADAALVKFYHSTSLYNLKKPAEDALGRNMNCIVFSGVFELPGEHGFRFFPSFYHNLFDTMRRTPLLTGSGPGSKTADEPGHSVFDNLCPTESILISLEPKRSFTVPRRFPRSLRAFREAIHRIYDSLGFSPRDMLRMEAKLLQYATSCRKRREDEYENVSWFDFVGGPAYSDTTRKYLESSSQALGALRAKDSDARTYGNTVIQLLYDQMTQGEHSDATLAGPTTESWFAHWHHFLHKEGVHFAHGSLVGFENDKGRIVPSCNWDPEQEQHERTLDRADAAAVHKEQERHNRVLDKGRSLETLFSSETYFVIALPIQEVARLAANYDPKPTGGETQPANPAKGTRPRARREDAGAHIRRRAQAAEAPLDTPQGLQPADAIKSTPGKDPKDTQGETLSTGLNQVLELLGDNWEKDLQTPAPSGPLKHLSGIQFFFREELHFINGHILYPDAPWGLTSIAQSARWFRYHGRWDGFRSVLSVDIADWGTKCKGYGKAWECTREELARGVWEQISGTLGKKKVEQEGGVLPEPAYFHIDESIEFDSATDAGRPRRDHAPFLVNIKGNYRKRPGAPGNYQVFSERWLFAGNYTQTHTRLTTMEAPNESARHVVNAFLARDNEYRGDRVPVVNLEETSEPADLAWFKRLDEYLFDRGATHFMDITGGTQLLMNLLPSDRSDLSEILKW